VEDETMKKLHLILTGFVATLWMFMRMTSNAELVISSTTSIPSARIAPSPYPTLETVVYAISADDYGIDNTGSTDTTAALQQMIDDVHCSGGGTAFLPKGKYRIDGNLALKEGVWLRGVWDEPVAGQPIKGTVISIYGGRNSLSPVPTIEFAENSGVKELVFWHPEQTATDIVAYPPTLGYFRPADEGIRRCLYAERITFINSYVGLSFKAAIATKSPCALVTLKNIHGTALKTAINFGRCTDNPKWYGLFFEPDYWKHSGFPEAPMGDSHANWMKANGTGIDFKTTGQTYVQFGRFKNYKYGIYQTNGDTSIYGIEFLDCETALQMDPNPGGIMGGQRIRAVSCTFQGSNYGLHYDVDDTGVAGEGIYHSCVFEGGIAAAHIADAKFQGFHSCTFKNKVVVNAGELSVVDSDFTHQGSHLDVEGDTSTAIMLGNRFAGHAFEHTDSSAGARIIIDHAPKSYQPIPTYNWTSFNNNIPDFKPGHDVLYNVVDDYGAVGDGSTDDTDAFTNALIAAGTAGGGIVFVPGGKYNLGETTLTIPSEVELRGVSDGIHYPAGDDYASVLYVKSGHGNTNGTPFIRMSANSGVRGLSFFYPDQEIPAIGYPFMIQGLGPNCYLFNLSATNPDRTCDFMTHKCDNLYIDSLYHNALEIGYQIGGGTTNARVISGQQRGFWTFVPSSISTTNPPPEKDDLNHYTDKSLTQFMLGDVDGLMMAASFMRENLYGVRMVSQGGKAPRNVLTINTGGESVQRGYDIQGLDGDLNILNSQVKCNIAATSNNLEKYQFKLDYAGSSKVTLFGTILDSKVENEATILDGSLSLQACWFDQQITQSGFRVESNGYFNMSASYAAELMPFYGAGSIDVEGCVFGNSVADDNPTRLTALWHDNAVPGKGRAVHAQLYETEHAAGLTLLDTADSDNVVAARADVVEDGGTHSSQWFQGRMPVPVGGDDVGRLYLDVTDPNLIGQNIDCKLTFRYYIDEGSSGFLKIHYSGPSGENQVFNINLSGVKSNKWISKGKVMNNCMFENTMMDGDLRIEVPKTATASFLWVSVTEMGSWKEFTNDDFELGFGNWVDGGDDAKLSQDNAIGNQCVEIQDDSGTESAIWLVNPLDLTNYRTLKIKFTYLTTNVNEEEDFWLEYSDDGGSSWVLIKAFVLDVDFANGVRQNPEFILADTDYNFTSNVNIRFMCDASANTDNFFLDNIVISGYAPGEELSDYAVWAEQHGLVQGPEGDDDGDGLKNLGEFGLGGNPTNAGERGYLPLFGRNNGALEYTHVQQSDTNNGLRYYLELSDNLVSNVWTNAGYTVVGSGPFTNGFDAVTNRVETNVRPEQFIRLMIEEQ
jgi:hypothetical protein